MIGIYGGTFDPIHYGHLRTALEVKQIFSLDEMRLIPCSQPAHGKIPLSTAETRLKMITLAISNHPELVVDRRELDREGFSYMVDTLKSLREENKDQPLLLFIGTDAFKGLTSWHLWQQLFDYAHLVVMTRPGYKESSLGEFLSSKWTKKKESLRQNIAGYLFFQSVTQLDISATTIRQMIQQGKKPDFLLPENVVDYIKANKLYMSQ
ncbi:MAG: nicotinate-nucleotide adenylyltransferase [Methylococcales bacterium]|nr:nicotinate-nucleotide adenylyltransferase [Methylococcales bacterium]